MSEQRKSNSSRRTSGNRKINRSQKKAMEVRSAASKPPEPAVEESPPVAAAPPKGRSTVRTRRRGAQALTAKPALLTRAQEYAFIRSDFRRLLVTAGSLLAVMLVLLVVIE